MQNCSGLNKKKKKKDGLEATQLRKKGSRSNIDRSKLKESLEACKQVRRQAREVVYIKEDSLFALTSQK